MSQSAVLRVFLLACLFWAVSAQAEDERTLDFIYVNANTGESAGGHTAIRLGSTVFHYQFFPQGRFLLVRESWSHFRYIYNELRNRSIFIVRTPLKPAVYAKLRNHLTGLLMVQQQDLNQLQDAETQLNYLTQLIAGADYLEIEAVGLFDRDRRNDESMDRLHQIIQQQLGDDYLVQMRQQVESKLVDLAVEPTRLSSGIPWVQRLQALLLERMFIQFVETGASLAEDSIFGESVNTPELTANERQILERYRKKLIASVVGMLQSQRFDRSAPLMLQTARYLAVDRSLETGILLTLDPFSLRANPVTVTQKDELHGLQVQLQQDAIQAQHNFFNETVHPDIAYAILESSMGRLHEIEGAMFYGRPVRVEPGILLPARKGRVSIADFSFPRARLSVFFDETKVKLSQLKQQIGQRYTYDLIAQNCATELLRAVNSAFIDPTAGQQALGGWLTPDDGLVFIPNQFYTQITAHFPTQKREYFPSRRLRQLEQFDENEYPLLIGLRESNTLSSTLYTPRIEDTPFLFFTDDTLLLRPVQGAANLLWGVVHSVGGVLALPVDRGERLHQGLRGMFYSLPELVFGNIRKGTYGFSETTTAGP